MRAGLFVLAAVLVVCTQALAALPAAEQSSQLMNVQGTSKVRWSNISLAGAFAACMYHAC